MIEERSIRDTMNADMQTDEGRRLVKDFQQKFAPIIRECVQAQREASEFDRLELLVHINDDGSIGTTRYGNPSGVGGCLVQQLLGKPLATPHTVHWLRIEIDPRAWLTAPAK